MPPQILVKTLMFSKAKPSINTKFSHPTLSAINILNKVSSEYPNAISLGAGRPHDQFCKPENLVRLLPTFRKFHESKNPNMPFDKLIGQYGPSEGFINSYIAEHLYMDEGINVSAKDIVVTLGFQEAAELCIKTLFQNNESLVVPDPTFVGIAGSAIINNINVIPLSWWKSDNFTEEEENKFTLELEKAKLNNKPIKGVYVIPDFNNPYGGVMPLYDRFRLLNWADRNDVIIIEDNPYGYFRYEGISVPSLKSLDKTKSVIYIGSTAKTIYPALRGGYIVADQIVRRGTEEVTLASQITLAKSYTTVNTPGLEQALFAAVLLENEFSLKKYASAQCAYNKNNLEVMLKALDQHFGKTSSIQWNKPIGGYFLVLDLPFKFMLEEMRECAKLHNVIVTPVSLLSMMGVGENSIRLSFTNVNPMQIHQAIERLANYVDYKLKATHNVGLKMISCKM